MNFEAIIGLEIHVQMKTNSKMFSSAPVTFGKPSNTNVAPLDLALPGAMPTVNKQAVIHAIRVSNALHMDIDNELHFDRKNYFYSDLSKGYQITQRRRPLGKNGYLVIDDEKINIEKLQIEEDTCKQVHYKDCTLLDFNRSGIPLLEIVTLPELKDGKTAKKFVEKLRLIVLYLGVSDGKMEEGSLRCDVNISLRPIGSSRYGDKVEIKNINTLTNIQKAVDYEIRRQERILLSGGYIKKETRRFDESSQTTKPMRIKTETLDYKYFPDPNILPIKLDDEFIKRAIESSPVSVDEKINRYKNLGLSDYQTNLLIYNKDNCDYFDELLLDCNNPVLCANWVITEVQTVLNKTNKSIKEFTVTPKELSSLLNLLVDKKISYQRAKEIFNEMIKTGKNVDDVYQVRSLIDEKELIGIIDKIISDNPKLVIDYQNGKDKVVKYIVGQVMRITGGNIDPKLTNELVINKLKEK